MGSANATESKCAMESGVIAAIVILTLISCGLATALIVVLVRARTNRTNNDSWSNSTTSKNNPFYKPSIRIQAPEDSHAETEVDDIVDSDSNSGRSREQTTVL